MKELAKKFNITVAWFYSETGNVKGLVDAMLTFGCKQPKTNDLKMVFLFTGIFKGGFLHGTLLHCRSAPSSSSQSKAN